MDKNEAEIHMQNMQLALLLALKHNSNAAGESVVNRVIYRCPGMESFAYKENPQTLQWGKYQQCNKI